MRKGKRGRWMKLGRVGVLGERRVDEGWMQGRGTSSNSQGV